MSVGLSEKERRRPNALLVVPAADVGATELLDAGASCDRGVGTTGNDDAENSFPCKRLGVIISLTLIMFAPPTTGGVGVDGTAGVPVDEEAVRESKSDDGTDRCRSDASGDGNDAGRIFFGRSSTALAVLLGVPPALPLTSPGLPVLLAVLAVVWDFDILLTGR